MSEKVYITGISGQIGPHVGRHLRRQGYRVMGVDIVEPRKDSCDEFLHVDIVGDAELLASSVAGSGCGHVIHLAAIIAPTDEPDDRVFAANVLGTHNVVSAAAAGGAPRLIYMSSESVLGFAFSGQDLRPLFAPITEEHSARSLDPYGSSKLLAETLAAVYSARTGAAAFSLRPPWVWIPEKVERYLELVDNPALWSHGLWAYLAIEDLCSAVERAMLCDATGHHSLFLAARTNGTSRPSAELLREHYGFEGPFRDGFAGDESVISSASAESLLGWRPRWTWREWLAHTQRARARTGDLPTGSIESAS